MSLAPWNVEPQWEDPERTDIRFLELEALKNALSGAWPTNPRTRPGTIVYMPPTHPTLPVHEYLFRTARTLDIQMYGWAHKGLQDLIVGRKLADPAWDVRVLVNRNGYLTAGGMRDLIGSEPALKQAPWFRLGTGEGQPDGKWAGRIMHRKAFIVDGVWFCHGSTNWDESSLNAQGNTFSVTYDPALCAEMKALFNRSFDYALAKGDVWSQVQ